MLRTTALTQTCVGAWPKLLLRKLFTNAKLDKAEVRRRKDLAGAEALVYLQVLWKETGPVTEAELAAIGAERLFPPGTAVTCHALAVESALSAKDKDKLDKRVRCIMRAAKHYGLVEEIKHGPKKNGLLATPLLHHILEMHHLAVEEAMAAVFPAKEAS
jgi:hypothetical protein